MTNEILSVSEDCQIVSTRVFDATKEDVFKAWGEPQYLAKWWGPAGFTNTFHQFDFKPGGKWVFTMHGPDKGNYENECVFIKIEKPALIAWNRISRPIFQVVALFDEAGENKTRIIFKMLFETTRECDKLRGFVPEKNEENFDRLEVVLKGMGG